MGSIAFSVLSLFASNEVGAWYDPSDMTTLFQDAAGTIPVTAVEQPVGLVLDKSKGLVVGSELITNAADRDFSSDTGFWLKQGTVAISGGTANWTAAADNSAIYRFNFLTTGKYYEITFTITSISSGAIGVWNASFQYSSPGTYTVRWLANTTTVGIKCFGVTTASVDNVSWKEVQGSHLSQSTAAARPVLSARVNLLTYTEQFDVAVWQKVNVTGSYNTLDTTDPLGGNTADKFLETTTNGGHYVDTTLGIPVSINTAYTRSVCVKFAGRQWIALDMYDTESRYTYFDIQNGIIGNIAPGTTASITALGNGWFRCAVTRIVSQTSVFLATLSAPSNGGNVLFVGDITKGFYLWGADLRPANAGVGLPAYQRVGAATSGSSTAAGNADYNTIGFPLYLKFDGTDDFLQSATIMPGADKAQVFAGVRKLSDAATNVIMELSASLTTNNGVVALFAPVSAGNTYTFASKGTNQVVATSSGTFVAPITNVLTCLGDISGDRATLFVNEIQVDQSVGDQGTGNYLAYPLYIGSRGGSSFRFNGQLYQLILRFSATNLDVSTITQVENFVEQKTFGKDMSYVYIDELTTAQNDLITATDGDQIYMSVNYQ